MKLLKGETGVYLNTFLRSSGMNLVAIFIPLYIYQLTGKLENVFLFYGLYHLLVLLSALPAGWVTQRIGVDWTEFLGSVLRALVLYLLILGKQNYIFLGLAASLWGVTVSFYWLPFHYTVVGAEDGDGHFGKETSGIKIVEQITASLGPFLGGLIIAGLGFSWLYGLAILLVLLSGIPMFFDQFTKKGMRFDLKEIKKSFCQKRNSRLIISFAGVGLKNVVLSIAWPLFIFLAVKRYEVVGGIQTAALLISLALLWWLGKWIDKRGSGILKWGIVINSFVWLIRSFLITPLTIFLSHVVYGFGRILLWTPFDALVYKLMLEKRKLEFLIIRETAIHGAGFLGCLLVWQMMRKGIAWFWIFNLAILGLGLGGLILKREE